MGIKLNLGCGPDWDKKYPDYDGLDVIDYGQKYVGDIISLIYGTKFDELDSVIAVHFLEHLDQIELQLVFEWVNKQLVEGGTFHFVVPHMEKERAWILSHKTFWNEVTVKWLEELEAKDVYGFGDWTVTECIVNDRKDINATLMKGKLNA